MAKVKAIRVGEKSGDKKQAAEAAAKNGGRWSENINGVFGVAFGIFGLIKFALPLGVLAIAFGLWNMRSEKIALWKIALPLGIYNLSIGLLYTFGVVSIPAKV